MRGLFLQILFITGGVSTIAAAADNGIKKFVGKLLSGEACQLMYSTAIQGNPRAEKITAIQFDLAGKKFELSGPTLSSSEFNPPTGIFQGAGILDRKIVITSEVMGVGYETGVNVDFQIKLTPQARPVEFTVILQAYRNDYVFGSWVQGERAEAQTFTCR